MESQFFSCVPTKMLEPPEGFELFPACQRNMIHKLFKHPLYFSYPPPVSYQLSFLKWCMSQVEKQSHEVCDELYELYGSLVSQPQPRDNTYYYKSYFIGQSQHITLKESSNIISSGTTGLTTWQAAFYFLEWAFCNSEQFGQKHVLELGSGVGLVGLAVCSTCAPSSYCLTDYNPLVLSLLEHNIHINFPDGGCSNGISVRELDWSACGDTILSTCSQPIDCIIATDVVYDKEMIDSFIHVLAVLLRHWLGTVAYVTSTVRNEDTYQYFISKLHANHISNQRIETDIASTQPSIFHYDRTQQFEIIKLERKCHDLV